MSESLCMCARPRVPELCVCPPLPPCASVRQGHSPSRYPELKTSCFCQPPARASSKQGQSVAGKKKKFDTLICKCHMARLDRLTRSSHGKSRSAGAALFPMARRREQVVFTVTGRGPKVVDTTGLSPAHRRGEFLAPRKHGWIPETQGQAPREGGGRLSASLAPDRGLPRDCAGR